MPKKEQRRAKEREVHYTYLIKDELHDMYYYGVHSTDFDPSDINCYQGSSKKLNLLIKEFGIENFTKTVRRTFSSREKASQWEVKVLRRLRYYKRWDKFYNMSLGGEGYDPSGKVVVKVIGEEKFLQVPVDDPFIGVLYNHQNLGRPCSDKNKKMLSELYKGTREGKNNPVYKIKDTLSWRKNISESTKGKPNTLEQREACSKRMKEHNHMLGFRASDEVQARMDMHRKINNNKYQKIYLYLGKVFLHYCDIVNEDGVRIWKSRYLIVKEEPHPLVNTLVAGGKEYVDIKTASECLCVSKGTISNRIKNEIFPEYFYLLEEDCLERKRISEKEFKLSMELKYKEDLLKQKNQVRETLGMSDKEATDLFMSSGKFPEGTVFKRDLEESDKSGVYTYYFVTCPICSVDEYVTDGVVPSTLRASHSSLRNGKLPCRCAPKRKKISDKEREYDINKVCDSEGLTFLGWVGEYKGKETKIRYSCAKGNIKENLTVNRFLNGNARCSCCFNKYLPPRIKYVRDMFYIKNEDYTIKDGILTIRLGGLLMGCNTFNIVNDNTINLTTNTAMILYYTVEKEQIVIYFN